MNRGIKIRHCALVVAAGAASMLAQSAWAGFQEVKLTASDAAAGDRFGRAVAMSGNLAIIGSDEDDDGGSASGSAYVFDTLTGDQLTKLVANDPAMADFFGGAVAISGNTAIVGAERDDDKGSSSGSAYLFDVITGDQLKLTASDGTASDNFGYSVAISGERAVVGAWGKRLGATGLYAGAAYVFNTNTGEELFELRPDDAHSGHLFSDAVAISGDTILVGAPGDDQGIASCGSAYLFRATTGEQLFKLVPDTRRELQRFGTSVAISGNWALVGADGDYGVEGTDTGAAYLFDVTTGEQLLKLTASDRRGDDFFGTSVAISGNWGLVGAYQTDDAGSNSGSAYLFDLTSGEELAKLVASDAAAGEYFGCSVAISGKKMLIGTFPDADGGADLGSAYLLTYVPEPSTLLLAIGAAAMALRRART